MKAYGQLHHQEPQRELYVAHTDRVELEIEERRWLGIRGVAFPIETLAAIDLGRSELRF